MDKDRIEEANRNVRQYIENGLLKINDKDAQVRRFLHEERYILTEHRIHPSTDLR